MGKYKGFTKIDNRLIRHADALGLSSLDLRVFVTVQMHARNDRNAYCSSKTVAHIIGVTERTVEKSSKKMQTLGYLHRPRGGEKPFWDFSPLMDELDRFGTANETSLKEDIYKKTPKANGKDSEYYMNQWQNMSMEERGKIDREAQALMPIGSNVIFSGKQKPELNIWRVMALKIREQSASRLM